MQDPNAQAAAMAFVLAVICLVYLARYKEAHDE